MRTSRCRARALTYTDDVQAGDPGCVYNQRVWDEVVRNTEKQNELVILGQHDSVESLLAGATGGSVTTRGVDHNLVQIADVFDPTRHMYRPPSVGHLM